MIQRLKEITGTFNGCRILVIGDLILDTYIHGETVRVSREAPVLVVRKESTSHRLGGAANTAVNLLALGANVEVISVVGQDVGGDVIRKTLDDLGAMVTGIFSGDGKTAVKTRIMAGAVGTSRQQVLRLDDEATDIEDAMIADMVTRMKARAEHADAIIVSDYGLGIVCEPVIEAAQDLAREGHVVCVDSRYNLSRFTGVTAVTPNVPEAEAALGYAIDSQKDAATAACELREKLSAKVVLLTQGRNGMTLSVGDDELEHTDIVGGDEVTDVTGAGDTVMATFALSLAAGLPTGHAMRLANCAASVVVNKQGAATCTQQELENAAICENVELRVWDSK
ncbi:MAG: bifunctional ADP-heptose synthase [Myxococcota bacterium]|nr:bifunctional ADP-heptose synthase [Myxococcota bacterium]